MTMKLLVYQKAAAREAISAIECTRGLLGKEPDRHGFACLGLEEGFDLFAQHGFIGVGEFVRYVHEPVGVPDNSELGGIDIFGGVMICYDFADVVNHRLVKTEPCHDITGDGGALNFLILWGG